jgi:hypothetical protein
MVARKIAEQSNIDQIIEPAPAIFMELRLLSTSPI